MKRTLKVCLLLCMILLFMAPNLVRADDTSTTSSPESYLSDSERVYVEAVRGTTLTALTEIASVKDSLDHVLLQTDWFSLYSARMTLLSETVNGMGDLPAPDTFDDISLDYDSIRSTGLGAIPEADFLAIKGDVQVSGGKHKGFIELMLLVGTAADGLDSLQGRLNAEIGKVDAKVNAIAKSEKQLDAFFSGCSLVGT